MTKHTRFATKSHDSRTCQMCFFVFLSRFVSLFLLVKNDPIPSFTGVFYKSHRASVQPYTHDLDNLDPSLPVWHAMQDLCTVQIQDTRHVLDHADYTSSIPARWTRSYRSGMYLPWKVYIVEWKPIICLRRATFVIKQYTGERQGQRITLAPLYSSKITIRITNTPKY